MRCASRFLPFERRYRLTYKQEMFIKYLAEQGHNVVKSERKPRKTLQYKDLGNKREYGALQCPC